MEETNRVPITLPGKSIQGLRLSTQEYHDFVNLSRNDTLIDGMDFETYISDLMMSAAYLNMGPDGKVDLIKQAQGLFDSQARIELEGMHDTGEPESLAERLRRRRDVKTERKYGLEALLN